MPRRGVALPGSPVAVLVATTLLLGASWAQAPTADIGGRVMAEKEETGLPLASAVVELRAEGSAVESARRTRTDAAGFWRFEGLTPGRWRVRVAAPGFAVSDGHLDLGPGANPRIDVVLLRDRQAVVRTRLRAANELLAEGRPAAARREYELARSAMPEDESGPVLRAIARCLYLEGEVERAVTALEMAVLLGDDADARRLLAALREELGQAEEATRWLETLDRGDRSELVARWRPDVPERPPDDPSPGRFRTILRSASPMSAAAVLRGRLGRVELGTDLDAAWRPDRESWEVYVPAGAATDGHALVWISPNATGSLPDAGLVELLDEHRMIWIAANDSGNDRPVGDRMRLALDAARHLSQVHGIARERLFIGGYSGGGRVASWLAIHFPDVFGGALFYMGVDCHRPVAVPHAPGRIWPAAIPPPAPHLLEQARRDSRLVFLTAELDFNRAQTRAYRADYRADGFRTTSYVEIPEVGHAWGVRADALAAGLAPLRPPPVSGASKPVPLLVP